MLGLDILEGLVNIWCPCRANPQHPRMFTFSSLDLLISCKGASEPTADPDTTTAPTRHRAKATATVFSKLSLGIAKIGLGVLLALVDITEAVDSSAWALPVAIRIRHGAAALRMQC
jgi:hypothetical protein